MNKKSGSNTNTENRLTINQNPRIQTENKPFNTPINQGSAPSGQGSWWIMDRVR